MSAKPRSTDRYARSRKAYERACALMPGGVNSPVRAYKAVGRSPIFVRSAAGATVTDLDGSRYVDYVMSYGPLILGHAPDTVLAAISKAARKGTSYGMPTEAESALAELVLSALPGMEKLRLVNSGTEAVMSAIRVARAATGRPGIIKCTGCYHGHSDCLLVQAGSGATTLGVPSSRGVPDDFTRHTHLAPYNDLPAVERVLAQHAGRIAAMVVEPVAGNMGVVPPAPGYLRGLRDACHRAGALLILDEVMTGFRVAWGGAQVLYGVQADLTCLGKVIGGGLPVGAYGGRADLMELVAPDGPVYQAGTLSGNPLAVAAGLATLEALKDGQAYAQLEQTSAALATGLAAAARETGVDVQVQRVGSMLTPFFSSRPVTSYEEALACDTAAFARFFGTMLDRGVAPPPSQFEAWFVSTAHDAAAIEQTLAAAREAFAAARQPPGAATA